MCWNAYKKMCYYIVGVVNVYLTSRFFSKLSILGNIRLHQSKSSNIDHPKTRKLTKNYVFPLFLERTQCTWKNPSKMPRLIKRAIAIKEYEALAEHRVKKAFIRLCFDNEDSLEDDIDQLVLAELDLLKSSRYCLRECTGNGIAVGKGCWRMVRTCPMMSFCPTFEWIERASCSWTVWLKMMKSSEDFPERYANEHQSCMSWYC